MAKRGKSKEETEKKMHRKADSFRKEGEREREGKSIADMERKRNANQHVVITSFKINVTRQNNIAEKDKWTHSKVKKHEDVSAMVSKKNANPGLCEPVNWKDYIGGEGRRLVQSRRSWPSQRAITNGKGI